MNSRTVSRFKRFAPYLRPFSRQIFALFGFIVVAILVTLPVPWFEKLIIDEAIPKGDKRLLFTMVGAVAGLLALNRVFIYLRSYLSVRVRQQVLTAVRMKMYAHLQRMSLGYFSRNPSGSLLSRITNDVGQVQNVFNDALFEVIGSALKVIVVTVLLLMISPKLCLLCALVLPFTALVFVLLKRKVYAENRALQESQARLSGEIQRNFSAMKLIQAEVIEDHVRERTLASSKELERVAVRKEMVAVKGNFLTVVFSSVPMVCILWGVGGAMVIDHTLTLGALIAFTQYVLGLVMPVTRFFQFNMDLQAGYAALDRIFEVLDEPPEIEDRHDARALTPPIEAVAFDRVSLHFGDEPNRAEALSDVTFEIGRGEKVALVGPSGAGKTSVLNLLLRFYDPTEGQVLINGAPMTDYTLESLRGDVAYASQDVFLLGDDVRSNLLLGREAGDGDIEKALRLADADTFVQQLDGGLDARVDERGTTISGGQRQRLALARLALKDVDLYLLDEPTAALDSQTEAHIFRNLHALLEDRTALIVSHRFSFLDLVDRILVFSDGRLVEDGTFDDLMKKRGMFYALYDAQHGQKGDGEEP